MARTLGTVLHAVDRQAGRVELAFLPDPLSVSYTHLRAHETVLDLVCRLLLEKKNRKARRVKHCLRLVTQSAGTAHTKGENNHEY